MNIKNRQREVEVLKPLETATTLETKTEYETDRKVHMAISLLSGTTANTNNTIYSSSTHTGLTKDRAITTANRQCGSVNPNDTLLGEREKISFAFLFWG